MSLVGQFLEETLKILKYFGWLSDCGQGIARPSSLEIPSLNPILVITGIVSLKLQLLGTTGKRQAGLPHACQKGILVFRSYLIINYWMHVFPFLFAVVHAAWQSSKVSYQSFTWFNYLTFCNQQFAFMLIKFHVDFVRFTFQQVTMLPVPPLPLARQQVAQQIGG